MPPIPRPPAYRAIEKHVGRSRGLALRADQVGAHYLHVYDLRRPEMPPLAATALEPLADEYATSFTDLLVVRAPSHRLAR